MVKKAFIVLSVLVSLAQLPAQSYHVEDRKSNNDWYKKFLFGFDVSYGSLTAELSIGSPTLKVESSAIQFTPSIAYDFGFLIPKIYIPLGVSLGSKSYVDGVEQQQAGTGSNTTTTETVFGIELGIKAYSTPGFELVVPVGFYFCKSETKYNTTYYTSNNNPYHDSAKIDCSMFTLGVEPKVKLHSNWNVTVPVRLQFGMKGEFSMTSSLDNYPNAYWIQTGGKTITSTYTLKNMFLWSIGVGVEGHL